MALTIEMEDLQADRIAATNQIDHLPRPSICAKIFGIVKAFFAKIKDSFLCMLLKKSTKDIVKCFNVNAEILNHNSSSDDLHWLLISYPSNPSTYKAVLLCKLAADINELQQEKTLQQEKAFLKEVQDWTEIDNRFAALASRNF